MPKAIVILPTELPKIAEIEGYDSLKEIIGGWLEVIPIGHDAFAYIDEEGKIKTNPPPINMIATQIADLQGDYIRGPMVIFGRPNRNGDDTDVPDRLVNLILNQKWEL